MPLAQLLKLLLIITFIASVTFTYRIKYNAQKLIKEGEMLTRQIEEQENAIQQLRTSWSYLTSPAHLMRMRTRYKSSLNLESIRPQQVISIDDLPDRKV